MPDSNPGPLPQRSGALTMSPHISNQRATTSPPMSHHISKITQYVWKGIFQKYKFLRSLFFLNENFAAQAVCTPVAKFAGFFGIGLKKINPISSIVPVFENRKKCYV